MDATTRKTMIGTIDKLPSHLEHAVAGLNDAQLDTPYREGGWTVRQVVHHLADSHVNAFVRMKLVLTEDHPTLKAYDQESWARLPDSRAPLESSLSILKGLHKRWVVLLNGVGEAEWSRTAFHPENGEISLADLLKTYSHHGENHVGQILQLKDARNW